MLPEIGNILAVLAKKQNHNYCYAPFGRSAVMNKGLSAWLTNQRGQYGPRLAAKHCHSGQVHRHNCPHSNRVEPGHNEFEQELKNGGRRHIMGVSSRAQN